LFFALRGLDPQKLIGGVVRQHTDDLLAKAKRGSKKILVETDLGAVFGLEMATPDTAPAPAPATVMHPDTTRPKTTKTAAARPTKPIKAAARPKKMKPTTPAAAKKRRVAPR
jgi:hypothetical protein